MEMDILICFGSVREKCKKLGIVYIQKQPSRGVLIKRCSENMHQIYKTHAEVRFQITCLAYSNHISTWVFSFKFAAYFQTPFPKNTSGGILCLPIAVEILQT